MKILVVEDDSFYAQRIRESLEDRGYSVTVADSLDAAVQVSLEDYLVVICDVMLPNDPAKSGITEAETRSGFLAGIAFYRFMKKRGDATPFILLSAAGSTGDAGQWAATEGVPLVQKEDGEAALLKALQNVGLSLQRLPPRSFIVHGHDDLAVLELKDFLQNTLKWAEPIVLREQPSAGKTVIEKFEDLSMGVDCVFVLLTPDDSTVSLTTDDERRRARQNVIFELGFFYAKMGRRSGRVIALRKGEVELPSDISGIVWVDITNGVRSAGELLRTETAHLNY